MSLAPSPPFWPVAADHGRCNQWHRLKRALPLPDALIARLLAPLSKGLAPPHLRARRALAPSVGPTWQGQAQQGWRMGSRSKASAMRPTGETSSTNAVSRASSQDVWQPRGTREMLRLLATRSRHSGKGLG